MSIWLIILGIIFFFLLIGLVLWVVLSHSSKTPGQPNAVCSTGADCESTLVCDASVSQCRVPVGGSCTGNGQCSTAAPYCVSGVCATSNSSTISPPVAMAPTVASVPLLLGTGVIQQSPPQQTILDATHYDGNIVHLMSPNGSTMMVTGTAGTRMITNNVPIQKFELSSATPNSRVLYGWSNGKKYQLTMTNPNATSWVWIPL